MCLLVLLSLVVAWLALHMHAGPTVRCYNLLHTGPRSSAPYLVGIVGCISANSYQSSSDEVQSCPVLNLFAVSRRERFMYLEPEEQGIKTHSTADCRQPN